MKFGLLKSKIEKHLLESFKKNTFKEELQIFKKIVLEDVKVSKLYNLYDELSKNKGFDKTYAEEYLKESVDVYNKNYPSLKSIELLEWWVGDVRTTNNYSDIDTYLSKDDTIIENILFSKKNIVENLTKKESLKEHLNIPINKMVEVSNQTIKSYLEKIDESERKEIQKILSLNEDELVKRYELLSEMTIEKLENTKKDSDEETKKQIELVIEKIKNEDVNHISFVKLKQLNQSI